MRDPVTALAFDPSMGTVIRTPPGSGYGFWVGGHKLSYDAETSTFALFYRSRWPLEFGRGANCAVALSSDGIEFSDVWTADKSEFAASSIEVGHCVRHSADEWRLYISYEIAGTSTWRIDVLRAAHPSQFSAQERRTVLSPGDYGLAWIKDPVVVRSSDGYRLYAAAPPPNRSPADGPVRAAQPLDATVLAESDDGLYFPDLEYVFVATGDDSWHGRRARINSIFPFDGLSLVAWDGGRTTYDNYEEWCGLATTVDGKHFDRIDTAGPWVRSPHGSVRYVYGVAVGSAVHFYYEYTRKDGSHDLRVSVVDV